MSILDKEAIYLINQKRSVLFYCHSCSNQYILSDNRALVEHNDEKRMCEICYQNFIDDLYNDYVIPERTFSNYYNSFIVEEDNFKDKLNKIWTKLKKLIRF